MRGFGFHSLAWPREEEREREKGGEHISEGNGMSFSMPQHGFSPTMEMTEGHLMAMGAWLLGQLGKASPQRPSVLSS